MFSAGTTFLGFASAWACRGELRRSPGQGFLLYAGVWLLLRLAEQALESWDGFRKTVLFGGYSTHAYTGSLLCNRVESVVLAMIAVTGSLVFSDAYRWRLVLSLFAIAPVASLVSCVGWDFFQDRGSLVAPIDIVLTTTTVLQLASFPATSFALFWAVFRDKSLGVSRDWTHWCGIALWCCLYSPAVLRATRRLAEQISDLPFLDLRGG